MANRPKPRCQVCGMTITDRKRKNCAAHNGVRKPAAVLVNFLERNSMAAKAYTPLELSTMFNVAQSTVYKQLKMCGYSRSDWRRMP